MTASAAQWTAARGAEFRAPEFEPPGKLTERDLAMFARIGVGPELLKAARVERVTDKGARERFGIQGPVSRSMAGIMFPYYSHITGNRVTARVRRDNPEVEGGQAKNKYMSAYGDGRHLYFPPQTKELLANPATPIVLVEAEKSSLALTAWAQRTGRDLLAVATGGCWCWRGRIGKTESATGQRVDVEGPLPDLAVCDGRTVFILFDANAETNSKVREARRELAAELRKRKCQVKICELPQIENVNGPDDLIGARGDAALQSVLDNAAEGDIGIALKDWPEPEPLGEELPPVPPFDAGLLPASLRLMVEDVTDRMQTPPDFAAVVAVATLAGLCGRRALMQPKERDSSWTVTPNLWGGIVAGPGMMKSPLVGIVTAPARALEADWRAEYADAQREYEVAQKRAKLDYVVWQEDYKRARKNKQSLPAEPELDVSEPSQRRLIAVDATPEKLHDLLAGNPAGIFVLWDELSGWLAGLERQGRESERAFYLACWSGDTPHGIDRIGRGSIHVEHCCVSLFGGIQPARLRAYLADALRDGPSNDGLIQRFQLLVWPDTKQEWAYRDRAPNAGAMKAAENVYRRITEMSAENPLRLKFAPDAQALFIAWLTDLEARLRADDTSPFMLAHLSKYRKLMPSLALLFALADESLQSVGLHHAQQAADWCDYLSHHARRVYASRISPERLAAISLSRKFSRGWKRDSGTFTIRDVYSNDWSGLGTPEEARAAVRVLEDAGWVRAEQYKPETGRPSEVYAINPKIGGSHADD
jgi:putative DNA primase/helicase